MPVLLCCLLVVALAATEGTPPKTGVEQEPVNDGVLKLENVPPSPSSVPGKRIWRKPVISHWPYIIYDDEARNCAFRIEIKQHGAKGSIGWRDGKSLPFVLPGDRRIQSVSGLLDVPETLGLHVADLKLGGLEHELKLRLVDLHDEWPHAGMRDGFPVDAEGVPVILVTKRRDYDLERRYRLFKPELPRPTGKAVLLGDPFTALDASPWDDLDAERREIDEIRYPHHAALIELAKLGDPLPRTLIWSPGNNVIRQRAWSPEEGRLLEAIHTRFERAGAMPLLILLLPPVPVDAALAGEAGQRREELRRTALRFEWELIDVDRICGPAEKANRVADGLYTRYPTGPAMAELHQALAEALAR